MKDIKYVEEPLGGKPWASKVQIVFGQFVFLTPLRHDLSAQWYSFWSWVGRPCLLSTGDLIIPPARPAMPFVPPLPGLPASRHTGIHRSNRLFGNRSREGTPEIRKMWETCVIIVWNR